MADDRIEADGDHYIVTLFDGSRFRVCGRTLAVQIDIETVAKEMHRSVAQLRRDLGDHLLGPGARWICPHALAPYWVTKQPVKGPHRYAVLCRYGDYIVRPQVIALQQQEWLAATQRSMSLTEQALAMANEAREKTEESARVCLEAVERMKADRDTIFERHQAQAKRLRAVLECAEEIAEDIEFDVTPDCDRATLPN